MLFCFNNYNALQKQNNWHSNRFFIFSAIKLIIFRTVKQKWNTLTCGQDISINTKNIRIYVCLSVFLCVDVSLTIQQEMTGLTKQ